MVQLISVDCGRSGLKVVTNSKSFTIPSIVGEARHRRLNNNHGDDIEIEYEGRNYYIGKLAEMESFHWRRMMTESKVHEDTHLLILTAICKAGLDGDIIVMTGAPISQHTEFEKNELKQLLNGRRNVRYNGVNFSLNIVRVEVVAEGGAAYWSNPIPGKVRIIDVGSKTVNYVTIYDKRYVDRDSGTLNFGWDTATNQDISQFVNRVVGEVSKVWNPNDHLLLAGGKAEELSSYISKYFPNTEIIPNPVYANARGFYRMGMSLL